VRSCCRGIEEQFGEKQAGRDLRRYRRRGPNRATRILLDALKAEGVGGMTLLDIGGGVGAIQHELIAAGVRGATDVDASSAYLAAARAEAERRGHDDRVRFLHGDFVELAGELEAADIVTLDRVVCCYPDMDELVGRSAERAHRLYGLVFPRPGRLARLALPLANLFLRLRGSDFRAYLHPTEAVEARVREAGLRKCFHRDLLIWQVAVYAR
jgi:2-polyprenyl-3-methyl-5-hydroxy-6-metoxy-1,4-benzoquinol methylase